MAGKDEEVLDVDPSWNRKLCFLQNTTSAGSKVAVCFQSEQRSWGAAGAFVVTSVRKAFFCL